MMVAMPTHKPMKPPFSYYGGKQNMANKITPLLPQHACYVEPFCGGATILFKKPYPGITHKNDYTEVINDRRKCVTDFFSVLSDEVLSVELIKRAKLTPYSRNAFDLAKDLLISDSVVDRALGFYVRVTQSFSSCEENWAYGSTGRSRPQILENRDNRLGHVADRLNRVFVECDDALKVIKRFDSPHTLFYLDPPYPGAQQFQYSGYTQQDFEAMIDALSNCKGSFVLSCYDNASVPDSWERFEFSASAHSMLAKLGTKPKRTECVWRRFNTAPVRPEIQKLYDSGKFDCYVPRPKDLPYGI